MTQPATQPATRLAPYVIGLLGVGLALAGTMAAADIWPGGENLDVDDATTLDRGIAYLVALAGWGAACIVWTLAHLASRKP